MDFTKLLPDIGAPVSSPAFDETAVPEMTIGETAYAAALFLSAFAQRIADPAAIDEFARFITEHGVDWSGANPLAEQAMAPGLESAKASLSEEEDPSSQHAAAQHQDPPRPQQVAPKNYYDSVPGIAHMVRQMHAAADASLTHFAAHVDAVLGDQQTYLGTPEGVKGFNDSPQYFREVLRFSRATTKKIHDRIPYVTWTPGKDPSWQAYQPDMVKVAKSFAEGNIPVENLDRIISLDQDLTKYVRKTKALPEDKQAVMAAFEPALVDAAETATPDELSKAKTRWADRIAHALDPDGPPVAYAIRKQADNAIRTQNMADGSGKISIHATPELYALFKNWSLHQLNFNGTPIEISQEHLDLLKTDPSDEPTPADTISDINDLKSQPNPDAAAEDVDGNTVDAEDVEAIEQLTTGQRLAAIVMGMFHTIVTMDPKDLGAKTAHGTSAQLMIVQDLQTAYDTLGVGALPEAVRRPPGPAGIRPPRIKASNPDDSDTPLCQDPSHATSYRPPPWTPFVSEAVNIGPIRPTDAAPLACDSKLVGQIWNGTHEVLAQHRAHRFFTPTQRRAILARDRGCQTPGCTVPAVYCQIHHILDWQNNGTTDVDNAITLCAHHHGAVHNGKWTIRKHHGTTFFQPAPWLDPTQPLLRNLYWSL